MLLTLLAEASEIVVQQPLVDTHNTGSLVAIGISAIAMAGQIVQMIVSTILAKSKMKYDTEVAVKTALMEEKVETQTKENITLRESQRVLQLAHDKCEKDHIESVQDRAMMKVRMELQETKIQGLTARVEQNATVAKTATEVATHSANMAQNAVNKVLEEVPNKTADLVTKKLSDSKHG